MPHEGPELAGEHLGEAEPGRGRMVAIATVVTTLFAATTGFLQAHALHDHAESAVRAERLAALAVNVAAANKDQAQVQIDRYRTWEQQQLQSRVARRRSSVEAARWARVADATRRSTMAIAATQQIAAECSEKTAICRKRAMPNIHAGWHSAVSDIYFPTRFEEAAQWEGYRLSALRESANQEADAAERRFAHLAAALTMLAVAVFLFGYSLTPHVRHHRIIFSTVATGFALFGLGWAVYFATRDTARAPESAATAFANGQVALHDGDYDVAVEQFRRAVDDWPESPSAYAGLAKAEFAKSDSKGTAGILTVPKLPAVRSSVENDRKAIENGSESPTVRSDMAANLLFVGLLTKDAGDVREARDLSEEATERFEEQVKEGRHPGFLLIAARFTIAEADFALDEPEAEEEYCEAIEQMVDLKDEVDLSFVMSAARTDFRAILRARPELKDEADALQEKIDAAAATGEADCR